MSRIEQLLEKLIPDLDRASRARERRTLESVKKSAEQRRQAENAVFDAYRAAGIQIAHGSRGRKWED